MLIVTIHCLPKTKFPFIKQIAVKFKASYIIIICVQKQKWVHALINQLALCG